MTRVLIVEAAGNLWGSERSLLALVTAVPTIKLAVCCPPRTPLLRELEKRRVSTLPYYVSGLHEKSRWARLRAAIGILRACLEFRPDVIHLNQAGAYRTILPAATLLKLPIVAHVRIFEDVAYLAKQEPSPDRLRTLVAISSAIEAEINSFKQLKAISIRRLYNGYEPYPMSHGPSSGDSVRSRVACVGRLVSMKGQDVLIKALGLLKNTEPGVECLMVGDGDHSFIWQLKQIAKDVNAASSIKWLGFMTDTVPLLRTCSVLVCPSHREPLGRVILEAWDAGVVPVVFSGSGGAAEIVAAADGGIIYDEQTPESLASAIEDALGRTIEERTRLVSNGRAWLAKNCDLQTYGAALSEMFTDVASVPHARAATRRVLVVEPAGNLWGSERSLLDLVEGAAGFETAVCCPPRSPLHIELEKRRVRTLPYYVSGLHEKSRWARLRAAIGVIRACLEFRADVIHLNQSGAYRTILPAAKVLQLPVVAHIRIFEDVAYLAKQNLKRTPLRGLIAISSAVEAEIRRSQELSTIPVHTIYDAFSGSCIDTKPSNPIHNRIACVGRVVPMKGQDVLVEAVGLLKKAKIAVECLIVGNGDQSFVRQLERTAEAVEAASSIQWLGFVNETVPLLRTCAVLVCPSHREPLGRVILEAWDAGAVPVVFSGSGGAAEVVAAADGGIIYDEQTPESLASALKHALGLDYEERTRLVTNGRAWLAKNCNLESYGAALSEIFGNVCR